MILVPDASLDGIESREGRSLNTYRDRAAKDAEVFGPDEDSINELSCAFLSPRVISEMVIGY